MKSKIGIYGILIATMAMSSLTNAQEENEKSSTLAAAAAFPKVPVSEVIQRNITPYSEFTGYLLSPKTVDLRSRVGGRINSAELPEGQLVKKGELLFQIDPQPFKLALSKAEGELSQAEALATQASRHYQRIKGLVDKGAVSRKDYDDALSTLSANNALVKSAKAAVESAKLNLSYTKITSPIDGRVDRALVTEGNLITGGDTTSATRLTTIVSVDPIYAYFDIDEVTYHKLLGVKSLSAAQGNSSMPVIQILLPNAQNGSFSGNLNFIGNQVDRTTGTVKVRAAITNKDGKLMPGSFIRAQLPIGENSESILIDDQAIGSNQGQNYVLVLDENNKAEYRPVVLGRMVDGLRVIDDGLKAGDKIIIKGLVRPGMEVTPNQIPMDSLIIKTKPKISQNSKNESSSEKEDK
ncbi:efflux RND transporter periplasmic adaptor subunit [Providencia rustigianii]|uniref:efflux RND transporter periplasmic adaptor subunit n=1 Tax=Providencia rustigianii TaxID=158850 RepID=UPI000F6F6E51|nr:efflux RND transporter periplasmic adaptor subunit [Providencia rustigianii]MTC58476.1 efflux RND transporter periplasmic adaptor subunit [Providencia rustigianii]VEH54298.1 Multidrug resistance protein MdtE precursor [Providencia rustigianii]